MKCTISLAFDIHTICRGKVDSSDSFEYIAITLKLFILYITFFYIVYKLIFSK